MNNDLNNLNNTQPPVDTNADPTPIMGPVSAPTPAMQISEEPPEKKKTWIIIVVAIVLVALVVGGIVLVTKSDIFKKKEEAKTEEKEEKKEEPEETNDSIYSGVYTYGNNTIKMFYDGEYIRFNLNESSVGYLEEKNGKWVEDFMGDTVTVTFKDGSIDLEKSDDKSVSGNYKKTKDYKIEEYFNDEQGNILYFNNKYNASYKKDEYDMITYQADDNEVRVVINSETSSFDIPFDIKADGSLYKDFMDNTFTITFDDKGNATFTTIKGGKAHDGVYIKQGNITIEQVLNFTA